MYTRGYLGSKSLIEMDLITHTTRFTGPQPAFLFSLSLSLSLSLKCKVLLFLYSCFYTKRLFINKVKGYHIARDVATPYILDPCIKLEIIKLPMIFSIVLKLSLLKTFAQD